MTASVAAQYPKARNAYGLFILVLTLFALFVMVLLLLPLSEATHSLLLFYDNALCAIFLLDFGIRLVRAPDRSRYFLKEGGWLDLLGSIPSFAAFRYAALFRLARLSRLIRVYRRVRDEGQTGLIKDMLAHRAQYAAFITLLVATMVLLFATLIVLNAETRSDSANIATGWDAFWWSVVTLTTVGYGDRFPVTVTGRLAAMFVMFMGVGIIGALASILASFLVGGGESEPDEPPPPPPPSPELERMANEMEAMRTELTALRNAIESRPPE